MATLAAGLVVAVVLTLITQLTGKVDHQLVHDPAIAGWDISSFNSASARSCMAMLLAWYGRIGKAQAGLHQSFRHPLSAHTKVISGLLLAGYVFSPVKAQECALGTAKEINGNWYCSAVDSISYTNFPGTGHYNRVINMNTTTGACTTEKFVYSGSLSPLNEELALHIRGPTWLKQLAVYMPGPALRKRNPKYRFHHHQHQHNHHFHYHHLTRHLTPVHSELHEEVERAMDDPVTAIIDGKTMTWENKFAGPGDKEEQAPADDRPHDVGEMVTATIDGQIVSWTNQYTGPSATMPTQNAQVNSASPESNASQATTALNQVQNPISSSTEASIKAAAKTSAIVSTPSTINLAVKASSMLLAQASKVSAYFGKKASPVATSFENLAKPTAKASAKASSTAAIGAPSGSWGRRAYYNAAQGHAEGLMFLNHYGNANDLPGFGASLSYASRDGSFGVETPQVLGNSMLKDNEEIVILSDRSCNDGKCGYTRPGGLAYHGWAGDHKIFLVEFSMPLTGAKGSNADMPAIWIMNAAIALTSQYGENQQCSCWSSGCGELDVFEVLDAGNTRCKSTLHMAPAGGSSDYFDRPVKGSIKVAVVFYGRNETTVIQLLDDIVAFDDVLTEGFIESVIADLPPPKKQSVFNLQVAT